MWACHSTCLVHPLLPDKLASGRVCVGISHMSERKKNTLYVFGSCAGRRGLCLVFLRTRAQRSEIRFDSAILKFKAYFSGQKKQKKSEEHKAYFCFSF